MSRSVSALLLAVVSLATIPFSQTGNGFKNELQAQGAEAGEATEQTRSEAKVC